MATMSEWFGWKTESGSLEIENLFPLNIAERDFVSIDVVNIFSKILTDVCERTQGLKKDFEPLLWDSCLASDSSAGLVTLLSKAMAEKAELFIVLDKATNVLRRATSEEVTRIREDYKTKASSSTGTYISFKNYTRADMIRLYSALEYCTVAGLSKAMNISKAIQVKISDLRASTALTDAAEAKAQAKAMATALKEGRDIITDAKDTIETADPKLTATQSSMEFLNQKKSFYLGLPASYITGESAKGLGDSGMGDSKAVERGLKNYYFAIIRPVLKSLFEADTTFRSEDFNQLSTALEALKTFELTQDEFLSADNKRKTINKLFGLDPNEKGDAPEKVDPLAPPAIGGRPAVVPPPKAGAK